MNRGDEMTHELMHAPTHLPAHLPAHERALVFTRATSPVQGHPVYIVAIIPIAIAGPTHVLDRMRPAENAEWKCIQKNASQSSDENRRCVCEAQPMRFSGQRMSPAGDAFATSTVTSFLVTRPAEI